MNLSYVKCSNQSNTYWSVMVIRDVEVGVIINFDAKECRVYTEGSKYSPTSQDQKDK